MQANPELKRRQRQLVTRNTLAKYERGFTCVQMTHNELWAEISLALEEARFTREVLGHLDRGLQVVRAQAALRELVERGTQLQLFA